MAIWHVGVPISALLGARMSHCTMRYAALEEGPTASSLLWSRRTSTAENLDLCNMHGECFRGQFCWLLRSSMAWKLIAVTLQTHKTSLTRTEAIMPVMGPFTWLALGGSTAFVGQVWRRGPWDRREIIFTHGQDFSVSCLQLCKQPSP